jgi:hypothetical protein
MGVLLVRLSSIPTQSRRGGVVGEAGGDVGLGGGCIGDYVTFGNMSIRVRGVIGGIRQWEIYGSDARAGQQYSKLASWTAEEDHADAGA